MKLFRIYGNYMDGILLNIRSCLLIAGIGLLVEAIDRNGTQHILALGSGACFCAYIVIGYWQRRADMERVELLDSQLGRTLELLNEYVAIQNEKLEAVNRELAKRNAQTPHKD